MNAEGLIQAAGSGVRLGLGPKAFISLAGMTLLEHAVALLRPEVDGIVVAVAADDADRARALVGGRGVTVMAGGASRSATTRRLIEAATAPLVVLHDVVHPFATPDLLRRVLDAARNAGAAAPAVPNTEFLYDGDGERVHAPGEVRIGQKPVAFSLDAARAGYAAGGAADGDPSLLDVLRRAGVRTAFVPGDAGNIKITGAADLRIATALFALDRR